MGAQQSSVRFLIQTNDFSSIFTKFHLRESKCINYICDKERNCSENNNTNNNSLLEQMNLKPIVNVLTTDRGQLSEYDLAALNEQIKEELKPMLESEGFVLDLICSDSCSSVIDIFSNLIKEKFITPAQINVYLVICNNKHNDRVLFKSLFEFQKIIDINAITLNINEFNTTDSLGEYSACLTSTKFSTDILELSKADNLFAKYIIQYGINTYKPLLKKLHSVIVDTLLSMEGLGCDITDINYIQDSVKFYINDIIDTDNNLNVEGCQRLAIDLQKIIDKASDEMNKIKNSNNIPDTTVKYITKQLQHINNWFTNKQQIVKNNLIQFSLHSLALVLMFNDNSLLLSTPSHGVKNGKFFSIVKDKCDDNEYISINHFTAHGNPESVISEFEKLIIDTATQLLVHLPQS
jgi:hypothetical protein